MGDGWHICSRRGFLRTYSTSKVFLGPQNADNNSYPRFCFLCLRLMSTARREVYDDMKMLNE